VLDYLIVAVVVAAAREPMVRVAAVLAVEL
jgi:hypothetical protein